MASSVIVGCGTCDCVWGWGRWLLMSLVAMLLLTGLGVE